MDLGLALPQYDYPVAGQPPVEWSTLAQWAGRAEACGFSSVWLSDRLFVSLAGRGGPPERCGGFEPLTALAGLARVTSRVRIGTLGLNALMRPPGVLAKVLATLDQLSGGRLVVGIGAGPHGAELQAAGLPYEPGALVDQLAEAVTVLRGALEGPLFSFAGRHYRVEGMRTRPVPVQRPSPPIWIGGSGDRLLAVVARHADGWDGSAWNAGLEDYRRGVAALERACEGVGRDPAEITRSVHRRVLIGEDEADVARRFERVRQRAPSWAGAGTTLDDLREGGFVGTVDQVREAAAAWAAAGVSTLIANLGALPFAVTDLDDLELVASAIT